MSQYPKGSIVLKATARFQIYKVRSEGNVRFNLVSGIWDESILTENNSKTLSFNYEFSQYIPKLENGEFLEVDITEIVQHWVSGDLPNDGLSISGDSSLGVVEVEFYSKEALGKEPTLSLEIILAN